MTTMESRTLSVSIDRPLDKVYEFLAEPGTFPRWAKGLDLDQDVRSRSATGSAWLNHSVFLPDGREVYVPLRAIRNGSGTEVLLTAPPPAGDVGGRHGARG